MDAAQLHRKIQTKRGLFDAEAEGDQEHCNFLGNACLRKVANDPEEEETTG